MFGRRNVENQDAMDLIRCPNNVASSMLGRHQAKLKRKNLNPSYPPPPIKTLEVYQMSTHLTLSNLPHDSPVAIVGRCCYVTPLAML